MRHVPALRGRGPNAYDGHEAARSYTQHCGIARALNVVGERWTLLLVRELLVGPKRFKDFLDGLDGIGPNSLLRAPERVGNKLRVVLRRAVLLPPAGVAVYELTETWSGF